MNELVQSALDAANQGDKMKAFELLKEELGVNPSNIDALLALASLTDEPTSKRKVLNRVLSLEATNKTARDMMLELDRAEIHSYRSQVAPSTPTMAQSLSPSPVSAPISAPEKLSPAAQKPMVFRYSTVWLVALYLFSAFFCCMGLLVASQNVVNSLPTLVLALLFGLSALSVSSKVEVSDTGIRTGTLLSSAEIRWNDIASIKPSSTKRRLELVSNTGESVKVSTQVKGYNMIVELLRQKRPDLFTAAGAAPAQQSIFPARVDSSPSLSDSRPVSAPAFTETRTFQKSFIKQYGLLFMLIPLVFLFAWLALASAEARTASIISAVVCVLFMLIPFLQVGSIKVEPNKITIETFFEQKELAASEIKEIKMQAVRGRYGRVTNFVHIVPIEGKKYPLGGFPEGEEVIYGYLMNWWNTYQNR
jgi:hypothetical protein